MTRTWTTTELRKAYLDFFQARGHQVVPSSSLIPVGDPTLLLTSAGMVQFKDYFTGAKTPPNRRLASCQKCFRTSDIDSVGDTKHCTFFEMLGNFSIGDYFKKEAIAWAWEFVTKTLALPKERLWITIYTDDDEAGKLWLAQGVRKERILRYGDKENFWGPAGEEGPCGPSSEIHYDFGEEYGKDLNPSNSGDRFVEIWNNVFTQYYQHSDGSRTPLPKPNIDTGMGLERTVAVLNGVLSVFQTDAFDYLVRSVSGFAGKRYGDNPDVDYAIRVAAEHGRSATFLVADGVLPSNEGRGYVLRRILRRGIRYARKAGIDRPYLTELADAVINKMGDAYPELRQQKEFVFSVLRAEEERFGRTLGSGMEILQAMIRDRKASELGRITGADTFKLYDTFGFPPDITQDVAREQGLEVDLRGFETEMERQRERARASAKFGLGDKTLPETYRQLSLGGIKFTGYDRMTEETVVLSILSQGAPVQKASRGDQVEVVLRESPFYAEMGGQVGDTGEIRGPLGSVRITDTRTPVEGVITHVGEVVDGEISVGEPVRATVDIARRMDIVRNHTATHLLHAALRKVLGGHVRQAGSMVSQDRLRFDFNHTSAVGTADLTAIEEMANDKIMENLRVTHEVMSYQQAIAQGAIAFFGDKYGDVVRTCRIANNDEVFSFELCGGTHADATGEIGLVHIEAEGSVGAGIRRLEAVTGRRSEALLRERHVFLELLAKQMQTSTADLSTRVASLMDELDKERKKSAASERDLARRAAESLPSQAQMVDGVAVLSAQAPVSTAEALRDIGNWLKAKLPNSVIVLGALVDDKPAFIALVAPELVAKGYNAGTIIREVAKIAGGGGGGRPDIAQAGGKDKTKLTEALAIVPGLVKKQ